MNTQTKNFEPKLIGKSSPYKLNLIINLCEEFFKELTELYKSFSAFFSQDPELLEFIGFFDIEKDPRQYLMEKYIQVKNINVPGITTQKLIDNNLIDADPSEVLAKLDIAKQKYSIIENYNFCFINGFDVHYFNSEKQCFEVNDQIRKEAEEWFEKKTSSVNQNEVVKAVEKICSALNTLKAHGVISRNNPSWEKITFLLRNAITTKNHERNFEPEPDMFNRGLLRGLK